MLKNLYRFLNPKFQSVHLDYRVNPSPRYGFGKPPHPELFEIISAGREQYGALLQKSLGYIDKITMILPEERQSDPVAPAWNNGFLPGLDMIMLYTMMAEYKPARYIEIGSGNSTKIAYKAKKEQSPGTHIISIDPFPRAEIDRLAGEIHRVPFENLQTDITSLLHEGDILFVDNSHRILPNSDAMVFFMEVLPRLNPGVIVQIHDVYLPYDYPREMCDRFYSEQYGLAMYLLANPGRFRTLLPNFFIYSDPDLSKIVSPFWNHPNLANVEQHGGSFWLTIA
jgi:hypothetical protein